MEFIELRSGQSMKQQLLKVIKYHQLKGQSARHRVNSSVRDNYFVTVYDYDIKFIALVFVGLILVPLL